MGVQRLCGLHGSSMLHVVTLRVGSAFSIWSERNFPWSIWSALFRWLELVGSSLLRARRRAVVWSMVGPDFDPKGGRGGKWWPGLERALLGFLWSDVVRFWFAPKQVQRDEIN